MNKQTSLFASLGLTAFASVGTSVIWNGLPFIAKQQYGFSEAKNLALYLLIGLVYVIGALSAGKWTRAVEKHCSPRKLLAILLLMQSLQQQLQISKYLFKELVGKDRSLFPYLIHSSLSQPL